jgi:hypothetical protein
VEISYLDQGDVAKGMGLNQSAARECPVYILHPYTLLLVYMLAILLPSLFSLMTINPSAQLKLYLIL